jgi:uncharacterized protein YjbI with pentapeptide repeats
LTCSIWYPERNKHSFSEIFNLYALEVPHMRWLKRDMWKAGITITCMLLLITLMVWLPVAAVGAQERAPEFATPVTAAVQATPTEDATVTELNKEKLAQEVQQLQNQNASDLFGWLRTNAAVLISTLVVVIGGLIGLFRWFGDRRSEREKRAEERFQAAVTGLGDEKEGAKIGAAILLRTFLRPGYEQFYTQTFDLAIANLRLPRTPHPPDNPNTPLPLTTLSQELIVVFKEAFPLARTTLIGERKDALQSLDATNIQLDNVFLAGADLKQVWMPQALLRQANLSSAYLRGANLERADLRGANLRGADLSSANLERADFRKADLSGADLSKAILRQANLWSTDLSSANLREADLRGANLRQANLSSANLERAHLSSANLREADLSGANLRQANLFSANLERAHLWSTDLSSAHLSSANLREADLSGADFRKADLSGADLSKAILSGANLTNARSLEGTKLHSIKGLTKEQLEACKAKGAIIDEGSATHSSQSPGSPSPPLQSNDTQSPLTPSAQGNIPTSDADGNAASSEQDTEP